MSHAALTSNPYRLAADEVHVWCVDLDDAPAATSARLYEALTPAERKRSAGFRFEQDQRRFAVAHGALRDILQRYLESLPDRMEYVHNAYGKPRLDPEYGHSLEFNLSHSRGLALIGLANTAVGVDVEHIRPESDLVEIARRFFSPAEADRLLALPRRLRTEAFFGCWTKKEAYLKASGEGLAKPLDGFSVPLTTYAAETPASLRAASNAGGGVKDWSLYTLRPARGYIGALAIEGTNWRVSQRVWTL